MADHNKEFKGMMKPQQVSVPRGMGDGSDFQKPNVYHLPDSHTEEPNITDEKHIQGLLNSKKFSDAIGHTPTREEAEKFIKIMKEFPEYAESEAYAFMGRLSDISADLNEDQAWDVVADWYKKQSVEITRDQFKESKRERSLRKGL